MTYPRSGEPATWYTEGTQNNPGTSTVLATTGPIATGALDTVGAYLAQILISTDASAVLNIQHRNATDTANVTSTNKQGEQRVFLAANQQVEFLVYWRPTATSERLRVIPNASVTGNVCVSLFLQKLV
jgi:hypothetical protein